MLFLVLKELTIVASFFQEFTQVHVQKMSNILKYTVYSEIAVMNIPYSFVTCEYALVSDCDHIVQV